MTKPYTYKTHHGLLFKNYLVKLIKSGAKTQTRRMKGLEKINLSPNRWQFTGKAGELFTFSRENKGIAIRCPFGVPGNFIYIKEAYTKVAGHWFLRSETDYPEFHKWGSPLHMKKEMAKTWLVITDVRVERLTDITEEGCFLEGINKVEGLQVAPTRIMDRYGMPGGDEDLRGATPRTAFANLFMKLHGKHIWDQDPWVWVITYQLCEKPPQ